jgi:hypothetical protein
LAKAVSASAVLPGDRIWRRRLPHHKGRQLSQANERIACPLVGHCQRPPGERRAGRNTEPDMKTRNFDRIALQVEGRWWLFMSSCQMPLRTKNPEPSASGWSMPATSKASCQQVRKRNEFPNEPELDEARCSLDFDGIGCHFRLSDDDAIPSVLVFA